jgi:hypothetical protein
LAKAIGIKGDDFACYTEMNGVKVTYIDGIYYMETAEGKIKTTNVTLDELKAIFDADVMMGIGFSDFSETKAEKNGKAVTLTLKGISKKLFCEQVFGVTEELFETAEDYEAFIAEIDCNSDNYTETYELDENGKVTKATLSYTYTDLYDEDTEVEIYYEEISTITDSVDGITAPEDADSFIDIDALQ